MGYNSFLHNLLVMKQEIEDLLKVNERMLQLWEADDMVNESRRKHIKISTRKDKSDSHYDVDEVTVELRSDSPMSKEVQLRTVIEAMRQLEADARIEKVIFMSQTLTETAEEVTNRKHGEVVFLVISTIDR